MITDKTVQSVIDGNLCTQCGTCASFCPVDAIEVRIDRHRGLYLPRVDREVCNLCGVCLEVCPGHAVDYPGLSRRIFGALPDDSVLGHYLNCYTGCATDNEVRYHSASGGMVSTLLIFALEEGLIDGALVTRMSEKNPLEPEPFIARTRGEVLSAARSKYCPVPANIALKEITKATGRYAVVGLPCHIHGIRKAEGAVKELKGKIALHVGIFCGHSPNFLATEYLLRQQGISMDNVTGIDYRGEGWPGGITIRQRDKEKVFIPYVEAWKTLDVAFAPWRCLLCIDGANELADISFGDAWLDDFSGDSVGTSIIITRTPAGEKALGKLVAAGAAKITPIPPLRVAESQQYFVNKKVYPRLYRLYASLMWRKLPDYKTGPSKMGINSLANASIRLLGYFLSSRRWLWGLISLFTRRFIPLLGKTRRLLRFA